MEMKNNTYQLKMKLAGRQTGGSPLRQRSPEGSPPVREQNYNNDTTFQVHPFSQRVEQENQMRSQKKYDTRQRIDHHVNKIQQHFDSRPIIQQQAPVHVPSQSHISEFSEKMKQDKIQVLQIDTSSLKRRLTIVQTEIDRVIQERNMISDQLQSVHVRNSSLTQEINDAGPDPHLKGELQTMRDTNSQMQKEIESENGQRKKANDEVMDHDNFIREDQNQIKNLTMDINQNEERIQDIIKRSSEVRHESSDKQSQLDMIQIEFEHLSKDLDFKEESVEIMKNERIRLQDNLEKRQIIQNDDMKRIEQEQNYMVQQNTNQVHMMVAKMMVNILDCASHNRKLKVFQEIQIYSHFDKQCQAKLKRLFLAANNHAKFLKGKSIQRWYKNSLKPQSILTLNSNLAQKFNHSNLKKFAFYSILSETRISQDIKHSQRNALNSIQFILQRNRKIDCKRALTIWREFFQAENIKVDKLKILIVRGQKGNKKEALGIWKNWSQNVMWACRMEMLKREFVQVLHKQAVQGNMAYGIAEQKKLRIIKQGLFFKAWQDYIAFKRYHVKQQVNALRLGKEFQKSLLQSVFDAIKESTTSKKKALMESALEVDVDVAIEETTQFLEKKIKAEQVSCKRQAGNIVATMLNKQIYQYFAQWKKVNEQFKVKLNTMVKDRIIKMYKGYLSSVFEKWKSQQNNKKKRKRKKMMQSMEQQQEALTQEVQAVKADNDKKGEMVRSSQRKTSDKVIKKLTARMLKEGMRRWREIMQQQQKKEGGADMVLQKMRKNLVKQFFLRYKNAVQGEKRMEVQIVRQDNLVATFKKRQTRQMYLNWCAYINNFQKQKKQLKIIFHKMTNWKIQRHLKKWVAGARLKQEQILKAKVSQMATQIQDKNTVIGEHQQLEEKKQESVKSTKVKEMRNGQRTIKNYFMRFYNGATERMFRKWKDCYYKQKQKDKIIASMLQHLKKNYFDQFKAALKTHISKEKKREKRKRIKMVEVQMEEQQQMITHNQEEAKVANERIKVNLDKSSRRLKKDPKTKERIFTSDELQGRVQDVYKIIIRLNQEKYMMSKKRLIFENWRHAAKQQKAFLICVTNVCKKSMLAHGLRIIATHNIRQGKHDIVKRVIGKYFFSNYYKSLTSECMNKWKYQTFSMITSKNNEVATEYKQTVETFQQFHTNVKEQNTSNVLKYFKRNHVRTVWKAWMAIRKVKTTKETNKAEIVPVLNSIKQKRSLQKWYMRVVETKRIRTKWQQLEERKEVRIKRMIFEVFQFKKNVNNTMGVVMGNFEKFMRTKILDDSFKNVKSFYLSKKMATDTLKRRSTFDALSFLCQRHEKILRMFFNRYKHNVSNYDQRKARARIIFIKFNASRRHRAFRRWRYYTEKHIFAQEVNEIGPVNEEIFEANRTIRNLKDFMRSECIPEETIKHLVTEVEQKSHHLIDMGIRRWKISSDPKRILMIKAFDHLKLLVQFRKIMRHWLIFSNNRVQPVKADMQEAFSKWRSGDVSRAGHLDKYPLEFLRKKNMKQCADLNKLANQEAESDAIIKHLSLQRDELLAHYIRSQKLGLALCRDNHIKGKGDAFRLWSSLLKGASQTDDQVKLMDKVEEMTKVKENMRTVEEENKTLANENDELRVFSMDGFKIAQNINTLSAEREKLTIDLADQANMIKKLLEDNQRLKDALNSIRYGKENIPEERQLPVDRFAQVASLRSAKK